MEAIKRAGIIKTLLTSATAKVSLFGLGAIIVSIVNQDVMVSLIANWINGTEYANTIYIILNAIIALLTQYGVIVKRADGDNKPPILKR